MKLIKRIRNGNRYSDSRFERVKFPRPLQRENSQPTKIQSIETSLSIYNTPELPK